MFLFALTEVLLYKITFLFTNILTHLPCDAHIYCFNQNLVEGLLLCLRTRPDLIRIYEFTRHCQNMPSQTLLLGYMIPTLPFILGLPNHPYTQPPIDYDLTPLTYNLFSQKKRYGTNQSLHPLTYPSLRNLSGYHYELLFPHNLAHILFFHLPHCQEYPTHPPIDTLLTFIAPIPFSQQENTFVREALEPPIPWVTHYLFTHLKIQTCQTYTTE